MAKTGIIEVTVKLYLNQDVDAETANEIVSEMDYAFDHKLIAETKILDDDISERTVD